jgi:hypothetical protein
MVSLRRPVMAALLDTRPPWLSDVVMFNRGRWLTGNDAING